MSHHLFEPAATPELAIKGEDEVFPVNRIFCVGRNYEAHAAEMGAVIDREAPFYFTLSPANLAMSGKTLPFPKATSDLHHEIELVMAIGESISGNTEDEALQSVYGYGCGLDMTRRDLQAIAKERRRPWDTGKDFENSAIFSPLTKAKDFGKVGEQKIWLEIDGKLKQEGRLNHMVWNCGEILLSLSTLYTLVPGDVIMTGTPSGVGPVKPGEQVIGGIEGLENVSVKYE